MKREVIFLLLFILFLVSIIFVYASEEGQVEEGYSYLENRVNQVGCSGFSFNDRLFINLATEKCTSELTADSSSNQCWPKTGCTIKSTAQTILALNDEINTTSAERWLLDRRLIPTGPDGLDWFLEIEITDGTRSTCTIKYPGSTSNIVINADKTISSTAGRYLTLAQDNYWLKVATQIYDQDITISCDKAFLTTLLFMKTGGSTVHVSKDATLSSAGGETIERVKSLCFGQNSRCDYEGSLWATFVLYLMNDYEEELEYVMPYLVAKKTDYRIYLPQAFLYYLTGGDYRTELLLMQRASGYWSESGKPYYDTAVAMLPFSSDDYFDGRSDAIDWLLKNQQSNGAWNNNIADTAFILYSIWPKETSVIPGGEDDEEGETGKICDYDSQCSQVSCKDVSCFLGECLYESVGCQDYDGCCIFSDGCTVDNDNDCEGTPEGGCDGDSDCPGSSTGDEYCYGNDVYQEFSTWSCDASSRECIMYVEDQLVEQCTGSQVCDDSTASCKTEGGEKECIPVIKPCEKGYNCVDNSCVLDIICEYDYECGDTSYSTDYCLDGDIYRDVKAYYCDLTSINGECLASNEPEFVAECTSLEECKDGGCVMIEGGDCSTGWFGKKCADGEVCENGYCVTEPDCVSDYDCEYQECREATCEGGACLYEYICVDECTSDEDCSSWNLEPVKYCGGPESDDIYIEYYNYTCKNNFCVEDVIDELFQDCNGQECYVDECYGPEPECYDDTWCYDGYTCDEGICVEKQSCDYDSDCNYEQCVNGECIPYGCFLDSDCTLMENGFCVGGECVYERIGCDGYGYCYPEAVCNDNYGIIMDQYFCNSDLYKCCDTQIPIKTCVDEGGQICYNGETCVGGIIPYTSDTLDDQTCCVGGVCEEVSNIDYCINKGGVCKTSCDSDEEEASYTCDYSDELCCVGGGGGSGSGTDKPKRGWILIVILLILIILAVVGIVFRDKLRTEWIKIRDKFSGKKEKKKFDMPKPLNLNPQGRILPRRILPPGMHGPPSQSRLPPITRPGQTLPQFSRGPQTTQSSSSGAKPSFLTSLSKDSETKPSTPASAPASTGTKPSQPAASTSTPGQTKPAQQTSASPDSKSAKPSETDKSKTPAQEQKHKGKKSEEKHKSNELEDVLKKLKEMSNK